MRIAVVVLAGGEGRRMAGDKSGRRLGGRSLLERPVEQARAWSSAIGVSVRTKGQAEVPADAVELIDDTHIPGPLAGIASALKFAAGRGADAVLTIPCDAPFLPGDLADRLAAALADEVGVAIARSGGRLHPVCALWRTGLDHPLLAYAATGRGALMGLAEAVRWMAVEWTADPVDPFFNVNSPQDLERAEAILANVSQSQRTTGA